MEIKNQIFSINSIEQRKINEIIQTLKRIQQRVISHEMAHKAVAGKYAGPVHYSYAKGPDGKMYITAGEVSLDLSEEASPQETAKKMEIIHAAALAPSDPSPQDIRVAQIAAIKKMQAEIENYFEEEVNKKGSIINRSI